MSYSLKRNSFFYEIFLCGPTNPDPLGLISTGRDDIKGFNEYRFYDGKVIDDWPKGITFTVRGAHIEDYLVLRLQWKVVSDKVKKAFNDCGIHGVQFLPVNVILENTGKEIGPYWALNVYQEINALDWKHTHWLHPERDPHKEKYPTASILKRALKKNVLDNIDIFRLKIAGHSDVIIFISEKAKRCLEIAEATQGFKFIPTPAY